MRSWSYACSVVIFFNIFAWYGVFAAAAPAELDMRFLPVGQGDSALVTTSDGTRILIDAGRDAIASRALYNELPFFDRRLDLIIFSHADTDHIGGALAVIDKFPPGAIIYNGKPGTEAAWLDIEETARERGIPLVAVAAGDTIREGNTVLRVIWPRTTEGIALEDNDASLVIALEAEGMRALFTGDIGFASENAMTGKGLARADVLKVSHHGSPNASGYYFIEAIHPSVSVVSVGENRYGHPAVRVLERLRHAGSAVYRTDTDGEVHIRAKNGVIEVLSQGTE